ncbi:MAG TPA: MFS transporter [Blastocatellia bacterium]|nr:MFS transporter [Blastocatellia bacterium]HAF22872.1 MFS transporter [Blastocatellia bacterium]
MGKIDTDDAANSFDTEIDSGKHERISGLWGRYRRLPRNVVAISLVSLLNDASSEIIYPLLPVFLSLTLGASPGVVGRIEGTAESISSLLKLFAGYFSDRHGKRKGFVVFGYALASFARPLLAFATSPYQVLAIRLTDRVGKGIRSAPRDAMIADTVAIEERGLAFGFHRAMDHTGAVLGPLIGYLLVLLFAADRNAPTAGDFTKIFLLASIPAFAAVFVVTFFVREAQKKQTARNAIVTTPVRLSLQGFDRNYKRFLVIVALFTLSNSSDAFLLLRAQSTGVSVRSIPLLWAMLHVSKVVSSLFGGHLSDILGRRRLIVSGWLLYAAVYAGFAFVSNQGSVWILFLIYGIYFGLAEGAEKALVADLVKPEQRGTAYGLYNLAFGITVLPASLLMGELWDWRGPQTAFLVSAILGGSAALLLMMFVKTRGYGQAVES